MVWYLPLNLSVTEDGRTAETGLTMWNWHIFQSTSPYKNLLKAKNNVSHYTIKPVNWLINKNRSISIRFNYYCINKGDNSLIIYPSRRLKKNLFIDRHKLNLFNRYFSSIVINLTKLLLIQTSFYQWTRQGQTIIDNICSFNLGLKVVQSNGIWKNLEIEQRETVLLKYFY